MGNYNLKTNHTIRTPNRMNDFRIMNLGLGYTRQIITEWNS